MRERTTWNRDLIKQAAATKTADPYLMNQDHVGQQPAADKYVTGDPSTFGEDVHPSKDTWEAEYANGQVKRDEIGLPEMRKDTFNHPEKTASKELLLKKGNLCLRVASMMLGKTANEMMVEDQAVALMHMPDTELVDTFNRLASDAPEMQQQAQMSQQSAYEAAEQKCKEALQAGDPEGAKQAIEAMVQAQMKQQEALQAEQAPVQQVALQAEQAPVTAATVTAMVQAAIRKANGLVAQPQQPQMQQQAQPQQPQMQQQAQPQQQMTQEALQAEQVALQAQKPQMQQEALQADEALLDDLLMDAPPGGMSEMDIEMDAPSMDVGDAGLGPEDEVLKTLFANDESEQAQQSQEEQQAQQKQAGMSRTASTRTVGTQPSGGVRKVGGGAPVGRGGSEGDKLTSLWASAPNVKDAFNM